MNVKNKIRKYVRDMEIPDVADVMPYQKMNKDKGKKRIKWIVSAGTTAAACLAVIIIFSVNRLEKNTSGTGNTGTLSGSSDLLYKEEDREASVKILDGGLFDAVVPDEETGFPGSDSSGELQNTQAGLLTGGEIRDLKNWDNWIKVMDKDYLTKLWGIASDQKISVYIHSGSKTLSNITVKLLSENEGVMYTAVSDVNGYAHLFSVDGEKPYSVSVELPDGSRKEYSVEQCMDHNGEIDADLSEIQEDDMTVRLDLMFVIDTTGSMGDELKYLCTEMRDVIARVKEETGAEIRLSVNFYRDEGDDYVVKDYDFTEDINKVMNILLNQSAAGGGDTPEAVHTALKNAVYEHSWDTGNSVKLMFLVLDAPPHDDKDIVEELNKTVIDAAAEGIRIIPVAASGADSDTQMMLRNIAVLTGGTFVFLDNNSGIGGYHDVTVSDKEYDSEYLNAMLIRIIGEYCGVQIDTEKVTVPTENDNNNNNNIQQ